MMSYDEYDVKVIEDVKLLLANTEELKDLLKLEDIYLFDIPEGSKQNDTMVKLNYIDFEEVNHYGDDSHGDEVAIQVDVWTINKPSPQIGLSNLIRKTLKSKGFTVIPGSFGGFKEEGRFRDSRRYKIVFEK